MMEKYDSGQFQKDLDSLNIRLNQEQMEQFFQYYEMLMEWNQRMNLTAITEFDDVMKKHFVDSLSLTKAFDVNKKKLSVIDVGTGAGFPGLALKIAYPEWKITLLDSLQKRIQFLDAVITRLALKNVETVHGRAEDYAKPEKLREKYDLCVSRAVANLSTLSEYCLPFVKVGGCFISYKSGNADQETEDARKAIDLLGGKICNKVEFLLPDSDIGRTLLVIRKEKPTPGKYPRKAGLPSREPLFSKT